MTKHIKNLFTRFKSCDEGATLVEYGIALSIAVAVGAGAGGRSASESRPARGMQTREDQERE